MEKRSKKSTDNFITRRPLDDSIRNPKNTITSRPEVGQGSGAHNGFVPRGQRPTIDDTRRRVNDLGTQNASLHESLSMIDDDPQDTRRSRAKRKKIALGKNPKKTRRKKIIVITSLIILAIVVLFVGYFTWKTLSAGGKVFSGNPLEILQKQRLTQDKDGRTNILIFGTSGYTMDQNNGWDGGLLTDSVMVLSVNQDAHDAYAISLPRDLYVKHDCSGALGTSAGRLNETYYCTYTRTGSQEEGAKALMQTVGEITGLDIQYYAHANWSALKDGVNAVGGVDVKIESDDPRGIYDVATGVKYKNGEIAHMDGDAALAFSRARASEGGYGLAGSNFAREKNQQRLLAALQKKMVSAGTILNPVAVSRLLDTLGDNLRTNFQTKEIQALIDLTKEVKEIKSLPFVGRDNEPDLVKGAMINGASVVVPVAGQYQYQDIRSYISGSIKGTLNISIDVLNGSDVSGVAQAKADDLSAAGYTIGTVANAPNTITDKVQLYRINTTDQAAAATSALEKMYSVTAKSGAPQGYTPGQDTDFVLIFGDK